MRILPLLLVLCLPVWSQAQAPPRNPPTAENAGAQAAQQKTKSAEAQQQSFEVTTQSQRQGESPPKQDDSGKKAAEDLEINRKLATFTKWLVVVGALQIIALLVQARIFWVTLNENRKLIKATAESADAAKDGARAAVESNTLTRESNEITRQALYLTEAADIVIDSITVSDRPLFTFHSTFTITFKNCGRTRGVQLETRARAFLPELPGVETSLPVATVPIIGAAETIDYRFPAPAIWMTAGDFQKIYTGSAVLRFEVQLSYLDVFEKSHAAVFSGALNYGRCEFHRD